MILVAARSVLWQYATFSGRASRPEFWWWVLCVFIILLVFRIIDGAIVLPMLGFERFQEEGGQPLSVIVSLALILPNLAAGARRLHDIGRTAWWLLIGLLPVIGTLVLIYFYVQPSDTGDNQFGAPQPL